MLQALESPTDKPQTAKVNSQSHNEYGAQLLRIHVSWQWRAILLVGAIFALGSWLYFISLDSFQEYWTLIVNEQSIFVETIYHDLFTLLETTILLFIGIICLLALLATTGVYITVYEEGIERKSPFTATRIHWSEVTKAEYIEGDEELRILGVRISSEYKYTVAITTGKKSLSFGQEFQKHPDVGKLVVARISNYIVVRQVNHFTIKSPLHKFLEKFN